MANHSQTPIYNNQSPTYARLSPTMLEAESQDEASNAASQHGLPESQHSQHSQQSRQSRQSRQSQESQASEAMTVIALSPPSDQDSNGPEVVDIVLSPPQDDAPTAIDAPEAPEASESQAPNAGSPLYGQTSNEVAGPETPESQASTWIIPQPNDASRNEAVDEIQAKAARFVANPQDFTRKMVAEQIQILPGFLVRERVTCRNCTICQKEWAADEAVVFGCPRDVYHAVYLFNWFAQIDEHAKWRNTCPNCRQQLYETTRDRFATRAYDLDGSERAYLRRLFPGALAPPTADSDDDMSDASSAAPSQDRPAQNEVVQNEPAQGNPERPPRRSLYEHAMANTTPIPSADIAHHMEDIASTDLNNESFNIMNSIYGWLMRTTPWNDILALREKVQPHGKIDWQLLYAAFMKSKDRMKGRLTHLQSHPGLAENEHEISILDNDLKQTDYLFENRLGDTQWRIVMCKISRMEEGQFPGYIGSDAGDENDFLAWWDALVTIAKAYDLPRDPTHVQMWKALLVFVNPLNHDLTTREEGTLLRLVEELTYESMAQDDASGELMFFEDAVKATRWWKAASRPSRRTSVVR